MDRDSVQYINELTLELAKLAETAHLDALARLLRMAALEAERVIDRARNEAA